LTHGHLGGEGVEWMVVTYFLFTNALNLGDGFFIARAGVLSDASPFQIPGMDIHEHLQKIKFLRF